ncbi:MAG: hypothetical protein JSW34_06595 [Candidatus Zixiibacteriota bacterium]|nr:MAG: hypothetical protein JSW34_06595 [candidate division Zixibacteria bacterium]
MRFHSIILFLCVSGLIIQGCCEKVDQQAHRQQLLRLNEEMRAAHLSGDAQTIIANHAYPYTKVNGGRITHPSEEDIIIRFENYMSSMKLTAWDDLAEPIVMISEDATLATVFYRKHLAMVPADQPDAEPMEGIYAWQSTYKMTPDGWKQVSDILTSLPEEQLTEELATLNK